MFDMATIQGAISGLQTAGQLAKALHELSTSIDIKTKVIDLQASIMSAQQSALAAQSDQFSMIQRVRELEEEIARVKAWEEEKHRYQLFSPWRGCFVYALKESSKGTEPPHWVCEHCYQDGRKSILQQVKERNGKLLHVMKCPHCSFNTEIESWDEPKYV